MRACLPAAVKHANAGMLDQQEIHRLGAQSRSIPSPLQELLAYWLEKCEGRAMPMREDLPHRELRPWYGQLALFDAVGDSDFQFRVCGTNLIRRFGREATNLYASDLAPDIARHLREVLKTTLRAEGPVVATSGVQLGRATLWHCEVAMPLGSLENRRGMVLLGSYPVTGR
jgi:hypothetical protein